MVKNLSLYGGQFTFSTQLITLNYIVSFDLLTLFTALKPQIT